MRPIHLSLVATLLLLTGCVSSGLGAGDLSAEDTQEVLEVVYRYQLAHDAKPTTEVFCLCTPEGDPGPSFLSHFAAEGRPVLACGACEADEGRISEKASGKRALVFFVASVRPLPGGEVVAEGGFRSSRLASTRLRYRVVRSAQGWKVVDTLPDSPLR